jgi:hypothetical protein
MRTKLFRKTALILCAAFVLVVFYAIGITFVHAEHHCRSGHCPVCVAYEGARFVMRVLGLALIARTVRLIARLARRTTHAPLLPVLVLDSPVSMNIRMND